jgi:hypothetical protein
MYIAPAGQTWEPEMRERSPRNLSQTPEQFRVPDTTTVAAVAQVLRRSIYEGNFLNQERKQRAPHLVNDVATIRAKGLRDAAFPRAQDILRKVTS